MLALLKYCLICSFARKSETFIFEPHLIKEKKKQNKKEVVRGIFYCALMNCKGYSLKFSDVSKAALRKANLFHRNLLDFWVVSYMLVLNQNLLELRIFSFHRPPTPHCFLTADSG